MNKHVHSKEQLAILGHMNILSLIPKYSELKVFMSEKKFHMLGISESWFSSSIHSIQKLRVIFF